jgi:putative ABC transport system permease protein
MKRRLPFGRTPVAEEVDDEIAFHLEMAVRDLMERGMTRSQAKTEAERGFGNLESVNAECRRYGTERDRRADRAEYRGELRQDVAFGVRQLVKAKAFSAVAVVTLALGIGATSAVFGVLNAVVLRPLPFDHPERIVEVIPQRRREGTSATAPEFLALRDAKIFERLAGTVLDFGITIKIGDVPEMMGGGKVSSEYFDVFGVKPLHGRTFTRDEERLGAPGVAVISHCLWVSRFNSDLAVLGRRMEMNGVSSTIIGVMPASFDVTRGSEDIWIPLTITPDDATRYSERFLRVMARLAPGQSFEQATSAATATERSVAERVPERASPVKDYDVDVHPYIDRFVGHYGGLLYTLLGAVGFVLLIACTNVANLLLARGTARSRELAIRSALGAGRGRIIRQLLTESVVLGVVGSVIGLGIAVVLLRVIVALAPEGVPRLELAGVDWRVLMFTLVLTFVSCLLFGLLPALRASRPQIQGTLREAGRGTLGGRDRVRGILVAAEVALAITLLVGSGLLIRSAWHMQRVDPGFDPRGVLTARFILPGARYPTGAIVSQTYKRIRDDAARIPGVQSAALTSVVPMSGSTMRSSIRRDDQSPSEETLQANIRLVGPGYFATMGIPFKVGRDITEHDDAGAPDVVIVNEALVRKLWPALDIRNAVGRRVNAISHPLEIVGVVRDLHDEGLDQAPMPAFYMPVAQAPEPIWPLIQRSLVVVLREGNPSSDTKTLSKALAQTVASVDPSLPIATASSMSELLRGSLETARMNTLLLSILGGIALVLAMVGIYGVVSYFVNQRTREIGIRIALGASRDRIWRLVATRGLGPIGVGLVLGFALSMATTRVLAGQLFGVTPHDPATLAGVAMLLVLVGLFATYVPARRAMRVPPVVALNES